MATFKHSVETIVELYLTDKFVEMEDEIFSLIKAGYPELAKQAQSQIEDLIAEQHYLDEGEELDLW